MLKKYFLLNYCFHNLRDKSIVLTITKTLIYVRLMDNFLHVKELKPVIFVLLHFKTFLAMLRP